jgi:hypothetical protein
MGEREEVDWSSRVLSQVPRGEGPGAPIFQWRNSRPWARPRSRAQSTQGDKSGEELLRVTAEFQLDDAEHFGFGCGFASPDFKLAGALLDEHFKTGDDSEAACLC